MLREVFYYSRSATALSFFALLPTPLLLTPSTSWSLQSPVAKSPVLLKQVAKSAKGRKKGSGQIFKSMPASMSDMLKQLMAAGPELHTLLTKINNEPKTESRDLRPSVRNMVESIPWGESGKNNLFQSLGLAVGLGVITKEQKESIESFIGSSPEMFNLFKLVASDPTLREAAIALTAPKVLSAANTIDQALQEDIDTNSNSDLDNNEDYQAAKDVIKTALTSSSSAVTKAITAIKNNKITYKPALTQELALPKAVEEGVKLIKVIKNPISALNEALDTGFKIIEQAHDIKIASATEDAQRRRNLNRTSEFKDIVLGPTAEISQRQELNEENGWLTWTLSNGKTLKINISSISDNTNEGVDNVTRYIDTLLASGITFKSQPSQANIENITSWAKGTSGNIADTKLSLKNLLDTDGTSAQILSAVSVRTIPTEGGGCVTF